jgi:hypothetical protein
VVWKQVTVVFNINYAMCILEAAFGSAYREDGFKTMCGLRNADEASRYEVIHGLVGAEVPVLATL